MLYDRNKIEDSELNKFLDTTEGFLKRLPINIPVKVKVYVYIIEISLTSSIHRLDKKKHFIDLEYDQNQSHIIQIDHDSLVGK